MSEEEIKSAGYHPADTNGDNVVSEEEHKLYLEFKRKELEDQDAMRDAQRKMTWFALWGMLLYPATVMATELTQPASSSRDIGVDGISLLCICCWYRGSILRCSGMVW